MKLKNAAMEEDEGSVPFGERELVESYRRIGRKRADKTKRTDLWMD